MKLSKAQQTVLNKAKQDIDNARSKDVAQWYKEHVAGVQWLSYEKLLNDDKQYWKNKHVQRCEGIVLTSCNSRTLAKLQQYGLIEIIRDSNGERSGLDLIKVLDY